MSPSLRCNTTLSSQFKLTVAAAGEQSDKQSSYLAALCAVKLLDEVGERVRFTDEQHVAAQTVSLLCKK